MPEIWLRYGTTDVVLDIRFENLANQVSAGFKVMPEEEIGAAIADVPLTDNMLILALSGSKAAGKTSCRKNCYDTCRASSRKRIQFCSRRTAQISRCAYCQPGRQRDNFDKPHRLPVAAGSDE